MWRDGAWTDHRRWAPVEDTRGEQALRQFSDIPAFGPTEAVALLAGVTLLWAALCVYLASLWWRGAGQSEGFAIAFMVPFLLGFACLFCVDFSVQLRILGVSLSIGRAGQLRGVVYSRRGARAAASRVGWSGQGFKIWWRTCVLAGCTVVLASGAAKAIVSWR